MGLNERLLALRDLKKEIIENVRNDTEKINKYNIKLNKLYKTNEYKTYKPPIIIDSEWPENRYNYNENDIEMYKKKIEQERLLSKKNDNAFGGGNNDDHKNNEKKEDINENDIIRNDNNNNNMNDSRLIDEIHEQYNKKISNLPMSKIAEKQKEILCNNIKYEKNILIEKINSTIKSFDNTLLELRDEKYKLMADLKTTDLKLLKLLKELKLLKSFEQKDYELNERLLKYRVDKAQVVVDLTECQEKLNTKVDEINKWQKKNEKILNTFETIVNDKSQFYDRLKRIFRKKVKRKKNKNNKNNKKNNLNNDNLMNNDLNDDNIDDIDDESSSLSSLSSDDNSDSDSNQDIANEIDDDTCPKDCDNVVYEKVMELREKRLDHEEILMELQKNVESLKSENILLQNKEKNIDKNLENINNEIQLFQKEKQFELNKFVVVVPLLLSQIKALMNNDNNDKNGDIGSNSDEIELSNLLPVNIDNTLIFEKDRLNQLKNRIFEQKNEFIQLNKNYNSLKKLNKILNKKIFIKKNEIEQEKRKCEEVQYLKYGKLVSLEVLDKGNNNQEMNEIKMKLNKVENESISEYNKWINKIKKCKNELMNIIKENTTKLEQLSNLKNKNLFLDKKLIDVNNIKYFNDNTPFDNKKNKYIQKLVTKAKNQAQQIDIIKSEIYMLQRKGGSLYNDKPSVSV